MEVNVSVNLRGMGTKNQIILNISITQKKCIWPLS